MAKKTKKMIYDKGKDIAEHNKKTCNANPEICSHILTHYDCDTLYSESPKERSICNCGADKVLVPNIEMKNCKNVRKYIEKQDEKKEGK